MSEKQAAQPMDSGAPEVANPPLATLRQRTAYALQTLVAEVHHLYPELPVEYSERDGRSTALAVTFDLTVLDEIEQMTFFALIDVVSHDPRVAETLVEEGQAYVRLHSNPRIQDLRDMFNLNAAYLVLAEDDDDEEPEVLDGANGGMDSQAGFGLAGFGE